MAEAPGGRNLRSGVERVAVIGGGVVGLWTAHYLHEAGLEVVVVERDRVGSGASRGNAGEVCPGLCAPLPAPGVVSASLHSLLRRDSALYVRPRLSSQLIRFLLGFAWSARSGPFDRGRRALAALGRDAVAQYRSLAAQGIELQLNDRPFLVLYASRAEAAAARQELQRLLGEQLEVPDAVTDDEQLRQLEPCLAPGLAGLQISGQLTLDPSRLVEGLAARLRAATVEIREGTRVTAIEPGAGAVTLATSGGRVRADAVVLAAGIWSVPLAQTLGTRLSIFPGKGYSFTVPIDRPPRHQLALESAHVRALPLDDGTRLAGTMEFDLQHDRFDRRRIEAIVAASRPYLRGVRWDERVAEWMGPRPMTPTGLPLIGALDRAGRVFVATGHNMFGVTLGPSTGRAIAQLIATGRAEVDLAPFAVRRRA